MLLFHFVEMALASIMHKLESHAGELSPNMRLVKLHSSDIKIAMITYLAG